MNNSRGLSAFCVFYVFLLSGLSFFSLHDKNGGFICAAVTFAICFAAVFFVAWGSFVLFRKESEISGGEESSLRLVFCIIGAVACLGTVSLYSTEFKRIVAELSQEFEGGIFSVVFSVLSVFLALYIGKRGYDSFSSVCILFLPLLIFPYILTWFDFIEYKAPNIAEIIKPFSSLEFSFEYVSDALVLCSGTVPLIFVMREKNSAFLSKKEPAGAFVLFAATVILEQAKYFLWFGADGFSQVLRPDRTMLSQVPFMNIQELFLFSCYISYILRISVFSTVARLLFEKSVKLLSPKTKLLPSVSFGVSGALLCAAQFIKLPSFVFPLLSILIFLSLAAYAMTRFLLKKHGCDKM